MQTTTTSLSVVQNVRKYLSFGGNGLPEYAWWLSLTTYVCFAIPCGDWLRWVCFPVSSYLRWHCFAFGGYWRWSTKCWNLRVWTQVQLLARDTVLICMIDYSLVFGPKLAAFSYFHMPYGRPVCLLCPYSSRNDSWVQPPSTHNLNYNAAHLPPFDSSLHTTTLTILAL